MSPYIVPQRPPRTMCSSFTSRRKVPPITAKEPLPTYAGNLRIPSYKCRQAATVLHSRFLAVKSDNFTSPTGQLYKMSDTTKKYVRASADASTSKFPCHLIGRCLVQHVAIDAESSCSWNLENERGSNQLCIYCVFFCTGAHYLVPGQLEVRSATSQTISAATNLRFHFLTQDHILGMVGHCDASYSLSSRGMDAASQTQ
jgi:hypothetical protein